MGMRALLREPLVHFLALGAVLFVAFQWGGGGGGPRSTRIVITSGQIDALAAGFARTWQRPPTGQELKGLVDEYVREEIAVREAMTVGLDRADTIIRRRLRQKFEFLVEDLIEATPPTEAELQAWLESNPEQFATEPAVSLRQVFLNADRRGATAEADARRLLDELKAAGPSVGIDALGDSQLLPRELPLSPRSGIARVFGERFADEVLALDTGVWAGPIRSGYGLHLVLVGERVEASLPTLNEVRPIVEREVLNDRRTRGLAALYEGLLDRYTVTIDPRDGVDFTRTPGDTAPGGVDSP